VTEKKEKKKSDIDSFDTSFFTQDVEFKEMRETVGKMIKDQRKAHEIATVLFAFQMIKDDDATDLTEIQTVALSILTSVQNKLKSNFLQGFLNSIVRYRKSLGRKSRKENVEMFKALEQKEASKMQKFKQLTGFGE